MSKKTENPIEPGVTGKGIPLSQLDTTGYDFGGTLTEEQIDADLDEMENDPEFQDDDDAEKGA